MTGAIVIIGGGQAGAQTAISLRELGYSGSIILIGEEAHPPYQRPPLSKAFLKGELEPDRLYLRLPKFYSDRGIELITGSSAVALDPQNKLVTLGNGRQISYEEAVIATGARARRPALEGMDHPKVFTLRTLDNSAALRGVFTPGSRIVIVGGGYIGLEVASALIAMKVEAIVLEAEDRVLKRVTSAPVAGFLTTLHRERGVEIMTGAKAAAIGNDGGAPIIRLSSKGAISADAVLVATGAKPNDELAASAGLKIADGILVDEFGRTSAPRVYACGDCTRFPSRRYGVVIRLESVQNAIDQAKAVASAICGNAAPYDPVPWFWSDQYETKLQIAGLSAPGDAIAVEGDPSSGSFAVEYRRAGRLVAVDAINNARAHMLARRRIAQETGAPSSSLIA
jgi:3-phenylpropionate/trans-cinnamate dioxygenase ferredoxin reductase subunit